MSTDSLDPALYARAPVITVESGIALCRTLADACPKTMPAGVKKAAKRLTQTADEAQGALALRQKALGRLSEEDVRLLDQAADASWNALRGRLLAYAELPAADYPSARRAADLVTILFGPNGLSFLKDTYPEQWSTADTILKRIDEDSLEVDIDTIAGQEFLQNIRKQHAAYAAMVKAMLQRDGGDTGNLTDHVRALGKAIVNYASKVIGTQDEDDTATIDLARAALRPLDTYREAQQRRSSGSGNGSDNTPPQEPAPKQG